MTRINLFILFKNKIASACKDKCILASAFLFSLFSCIGGFMRFISYGLSIPLYMGFLIVFFSVFVGLLTLLLCPLFESLSETETGINRVSFLRVFFGTFGLIVLFALPTLIAFYPGTIIMDAYIELRYASHMSEWIAHYSVPVDQLMYKIISVGRDKLGNDNLAFFLYTGTQFFVQCLIFSYSYYILVKINSRKFVRIFGLAFFVLQPSLRIWGYTMCKDTMYAMCILLLLSVVIDSEVMKKTKLYHYLLIMFSTLVIVISRKNGIYVIAFFVIFGLLLASEKIQFVLAGLAAICGIIILQYAQIHYNAADGYVREALSVPIQQTARYISYHGDELSLED